MFVALGKIAGCSDKDVVAAVETGFADHGLGQGARIFRRHLRTA